MQKLLMALLLVSQLCIAVTLVTNVPNVEVRLGSILLAVTDRNGVAQFEVSLPATLTLAKPGYLTRSIFLNDPEKTYYVQLQASANLLIESVPDGASVWINGVLVGRTPLEMELEPGNYEIILQKEGFCRTTRSVSLQGHEKKRLRVELSNTPTVQIVSKPAAKLWIQNQFVGETPKSLKLPAGDYQIKLESPDYFSLEQNIRVSDDETQQFEFILAPSARLLVQSNVSHAIVQIDDRVQPQNAVFTDLPLGERTILVKAAGYEERSITVELKQGQNYLYVSLEPKLFRLDIVAPQEALIFVDGKSSGRGPTSVKLSQSIHLIEARLGEKRWMGLVDLSRDEQIEARFDVATVLLLGDRSTVYTVEGITYRPPSLIYLPEGFHTVKIDGRERTIEFSAGKLYTFSPEDLGYLCIFSDSVLECYVNSEFAGLSPVLFYPVKPSVVKVSTIGWEKEVIVEPGKTINIVVGGD
ncbi:hypothetical protein AS159_09840 [Thermotoga sp. Ku-13t]|uniref:PEGA domain-containing protein n=1 Tax=Thermotoga sp. Ku-13t TaxID=1755813 RepID=UPI0013ED7C3D|nr:PEGA domain-containing protein [Thermotoga sp. Ku-13t]KAF2957311.1 hypothetical protein AS159_09840 [Thermotoga sp. Ku-13t]